MQKTAKNNSIVAWRILFTYLIMCFHFDNKYCISQDFGLSIGWYIGVEFFFIVSGYLMYVKMDEMAEKYHSGLAYLGARYARFYPYYLGAFLIGVALYKICYHISAYDLLKYLSDDYFEVFALQCIGLDFGWNYINNTGWFISALLICGFIIYHCLLKWRETFSKLVAPLIVMVSFSFLFRNMQGIGGAVQTTGFYENWALMRGMADMCLGIFAAQLNAYIQKNFRSTGLIKSIGTAGFLFVILCSLKFGNSTADFLYAMILTVSVAIAFLPSQGKIFQSRWLVKWSRLTMCMYMIHDLFRTFVFPEFMGIPQALGMKFAFLLLYLVTVTVFAWIYDKFIRWLTAKLQLGIINKLKSSGEDDSDAEESISIAG